MERTRQPLMLASALVAALVLSACGKHNEPASPVPSTPPPSATAMTPPVALPITLPVTPPSSATAGVPRSGARAVVSFSSLEIGSSVDANNGVHVVGARFTPKDDIYASIETVGNGHATLAAKWTYNGDQTVHEDSKVLNTMGAQTTAFMISKPDGFPVGNYKVEISLDGKPVASEDFSVKK